MKEGLYIIVDTKFASLEVYNVGVDTVRNMDSSRVLRKIGFEHRLYRNNYLPIAVTKEFLQSEYCYLIFNDLIVMKDSIMVELEQL